MYLQEILQVDELPRNGLSSALLLNAYAKSSSSLNLTSYIQLYHNIKQK